MLKARGLLSIKKEEKIGEISVKGKVDSALDAYRDIKYNNVAERDLNIIMQCLSHTGCGKKIANMCQNERVLLQISIIIDPNT